MEQRVSLVTLGVTDLARSRAFYEGLGWRTRAAPDDDVVFFQTGGTVLALWSRAALAEDSGVEESPTASPEATQPSGPGADGLAGGAAGRSWGGIALAHNVRTPGEVDAVLDEVAAAGGTITRRGAPTFWGGYSGAFLDPDGHAWEVAHNPGWTLADDGSVRLPD